MKNCPERPGGRVVRVHATKSQKTVQTFNLNSLFIIALNGIQPDSEEHYRTSGLEVINGFSGFVVDMYTLIMT